MKKKLLSLVCALALTISLLPAAQALEGEGTRAAEALASLGLVTGTGAGYAAEKPATQEQAAALLVRLLGAEKAAKVDRRNCGWVGVPAWARSAVNYCAFHDLIDWSEYRAGGALDAELWCAMLLRALGCGSELGSSAARTALRIGLISRPLEGTLTRGDLFETALAALTYPVRDGGTLLDGLLAKGLCTAAAVAALGGVVQETQYAAAVTVCALLPEEAGEAFAAQVRDLTAGRCAVRPVGETERAVPLAGSGL